MEVLEKAAEILVACGIGNCYRTTVRTDIEGYKINLTIDRSWQKVDPFADTLEGRRQADAIEDWLWNKERKLWNQFNIYNPEYAPLHQWRLDRIKYCLEQLANDS